MTEVWILSISTNGWNEHIVRGAFSSKEKGLKEIQEDIQDFGIEPEVEKIQEHHSDYESEFVSLHHETTWTLTKCEVQ